MDNTNTYRKLAFLQGGGEMGRLTRDFDWNQTAIGSPYNWPQSLRTTLSILLNSRFPMFLFWGEEHICFYNDAYRPSLGNSGKHPAILGQKGKRFWAEIWDTIGPQIDNILNGGEGTWHEDQFLPIERNGKLEDVYWTYSYSPVINEDGEVGGVLVVCNETTEQMRTLIHLKESDQRFQNLIREATVGIVVLSGEEMIVSVANDAYARLIGRKSEDIIGKPLFSIVPEAEHPFREMLDNVMLRNEAFYLYDQPYSVFSGEGEKIEGYLNIVYQPYREESGIVTGVMALCHDVTDQVHARKEAEESENRFRHLVDALPVRTVLMTGREMTVELANEAALKSWGRDRSVIGKPILDIFPEVKDQPFPKMLEEAFDTGKSFAGTDAPVKRMRDGGLHTFYVDFAYQPVKDATGKVSGILATSVDVTEKVLAKREIEASEQNLRSLIESAPFPIGVYVGREMRIQFVNKSIIDVWGKGPDVIGKCYAEVLPELAGTGIYDQLDRVYSTGIPFDAKSQRVDLAIDGEIRPFYFNYSFTPLFDKEGEVYGVMNTAAEITDLVLAKQQLEETEVSLHTAVELAELATWSLDVKKGTVSFSPRFMKWLGFTKETKNLKEALSRLPKQFRESVATAVEKALRPGSSGIYDYEHPMVNRQTGEEHIIHVQAELTYDPDGNPAFLRGMAQDVTQQRDLQKQLEKQVAERTAALAEANARLQHSNEELAQYAYVASHDLQEPLRKIRVFAGMLENQQELSDHSRQLVHKMDSASQRMTLLIKDLLEFSRLLNSESMVRPIDLTDVCKAVVADFELSIRDQGASVNIGALPRIEAVGLQMNQLFYNLLSNALKFSKPDVPPQISISSRPMMVDEVGAFISSPNPSWLYYDIIVKDNGIGFETKYAEQIFEVFKRLHGREIYPGSGIGLALCRRIAVNAMGHLYAESKPGEGATFHIILPDRLDKSAAPPDL